MSIQRNFDSLSPVNLSPTTTPKTDNPYLHLRVLILCDAVPERNGVGSYYADISVQFRRYGVKVEFIHPVSADDGGYCYLGLPLPGDNTQRLALPRVKRVLDVVEALQPHIIIVPTPGPFGLLGLFLSKRLDIALIAGFHTHYEALTDLYWQHSLQRPFGKLCRRFLEACNCLLFARADMVLANSPETAQQASLIGADNVAIMGTSVSDEFVVPAPVPLRNVPACGNPRIVFAGRLAREKNIHQLIEMAEQCPALRVVIAGDGPERESVRRASERLENLEYLGWVKRAELADVLDSADVFILPSVVESFGTVALEALARARPVLVTHGCGIIEWKAFEPVLYVAGENEPLACAVNRILAVPLAQRSSRAQEGRLAAMRLDKWNADSWLQRMATLHARRSQCVESVKAEGILSN